MGGFPFLTGLIGNLPPNIQGTAPAQPGMDALTQAIMANRMMAAQAAPIQQAPDQVNVQSSKLGQILASIMGGGSSMGAAGANQPHQKLQDVISILFGNQPRARTTAGMLGAQQPAAGAGYWAYYPGTQQPAATSYGYTPPPPAPR